MPRIHETAYPRLKSAVTDAELREIYSPTAEEVAFAEEHTRSETAKVGLLVLLKTFQRLGYFVMIEQVPRRIVGHITSCVGLSAILKGLHSYDTGPHARPPSGSSAGTLGDHRLWSRRPSRCVHRRRRSSADKRGLGRYH